MFWEKFFCLLQKSELHILFFRQNIWQPSGRETEIVIVSDTHRKLDTKRANREKNRDIDKDSKKKEKQF
jgi:hypothetical protein